MDAKINFFVAELPRYAGITMAIFTGYCLMRRSRVFFIYGPRFVRSDLF